MFRMMIALAATTAALVGASPSVAAETMRLASGHCPPSDRPACPPAPLDHPPNAKPGQCFAKVRTPPRLETYVEQAVVSPARRDTRVIPATYEFFDHQVLVYPERVDRQTIPATYRMVSETVVVRPAGVHVEQTPPVFDTVVETVLVRQAYTEWRRSYVGPGGLIPVGSRVEPTGEVMCLIEVPAVYDRVQRRVMVRPGGAVEVRDPPITRLEQRQVVDRPAQVVERRIPAVYRMERARRIVRAEHTELVEVAAVIRSVSRQREVTPGGEEWRLIDCPPAAAPPLRPAPRPPLGGGERPGIPPAVERGERG